MSVPLLLDKEVLVMIDAAARLLDVDRATVLLRGFDLLSYAAGAMYGHEEHLELAGVL